MSRTLIVSRDTVASLLEAHAALAAWYHRHAQALGGASLAVEAPSEPERLAFLRQVGQHFPEVAEVARTIAHPRPYVPPPAIVLAEPRMVDAATAPSVEPPAPSTASPSAAPSAPAAPAHAPEPVPAHASEAPTEPQPQAGADTGLAPPPFVDPTKVKY